MMSLFSKKENPQTGSKFADIKVKDIYRVHHLKRNLTTISHCGTKIKSEAGPPPCNRLSKHPVTLPLLLGRCSRQLRKICADANMV
jgi:hypothetical protein